MSDDNRLKDLEEKLATLDTERAKLILEINSLRSHHIKGKKSEALPVILGRVNLTTIPQYVT